MEGFLSANLLFFLFDIFLDLYLYLCQWKLRKECNLLEMSVG